MQDERDVTATQLVCDSGDWISTGPCTWNEMFADELLRSDLGQGHVEVGDDKETQKFAEMVRRANRNWTPGTIPRLLPPSASKRAPVSRASRGTSRESAPRRRQRSQARSHGPPGRQPSGDDDPSEQPEHVAAPPRGISPEELVERASGRGKNGGDRHVFISVRGMREYLALLELQGRAERVGSDRWEPSPSARGWWHAVSLGLNGLIGEREEAA